MMAAYGGAATDSVAPVHGAISVPEPQIAARRIAYPNEVRGETALVVAADPIAEDVVVDEPAPVSGFLDAAGDIVVDGVALDEVLEVRGRRALRLDPNTYA